ncbi:transcriptional regulator, LacI family [Granulicella pectinivorans]|uniref:Transcriptional regulator, LacI family n=1 Tax=Granulicella pectinivorans TaxID=474950 RepID=A0A1I6M1C8_9BACT|nr:LacI family DNA-binding transcriptional regulator [Granulicella pectinivorans]SFS09292.1 transcriptional regulator, LacI family [Granulicella pectinivorans]
MKSEPKRDPKRKIDIHYVAAHAGVSIATVSRALNRVPTVDPALAERVWKSVAELNYLPNTQARALVSGKSKLLGLIVSEITNPFFPELIQEFERVAVERGYEILIASTSHDPAKMEVVARRMLERKVDGVAIMTFGFGETFIERFAAIDIPSIFIDSPSKQPRSSTLSVDYREGLYEAVQHLAVLGHRKIGFITGPLHLVSAQARRTAFLDCLKSSGLPAEKSWIIEGDHTLDGGRDAMNKILALNHWPTAIMCSNDMTAIGVQHALFEAKLRVPEDFSLIGFDNIHLAEYTIPPLTTIRMSCKDLAQKAVRSLLSHLQPDGRPETEAVIPTRLIVRQTTGAPKASETTAKPAKKKAR